MQTVAIVGVGLIGGSFGLALRKSGFKGEILGVSSPRSIDPAVERGAIDRGVTLEEAAARSDLLFLSQPVSGILETIRALDPIVRHDALVTDAGSTKTIIVEEARRSLRRCTFVGGHPMAGKEVRGVGGADAELFQGRPWVLTSSPDHAVAQQFRKWIGLLGAREILLDAPAHDRLVAWGSHLPQLASTALASVLSEHAQNSTAIAGPGLFDMTRLAMSSYEIWRDILETNRPAIREALSGYIRKLQELEANLEREFETGAEFARKLRQT